ncbi:MAG: zinc carboxypeptidase, partial [Saprospiraceae bacterium]
IEHHQPWPGGRFNHYLFDLNRDWAWQTQVESSSRIKLYHKWMPHIHVDLHEMGHNSSYFFAPAATPFHEVITEWQRDFQHTVGKNNAKYFDKNGWLYFTNESYDLLYPSYGDTWPTFNGAIGFTYEQGGSGRAGISVQQKTGNYLDLRDRLDHHFTTSISSIQAAFSNREKLILEFEKYFDETINDQYKSYIIKYSNEKSKISALLTLLEQQKVQYGSPKISEISQNGFNFLKNKVQKFKIEKQDIVVRLKQPLSRFVKVLFEPQTMVEDSLTYDLTAWAIPYIYELETYAVEEDIPNNLFRQSNDFSPTELPKSTPYAIAIEYKDVVDVEILSQLLQKKLVVRFSEKPFKVGEKKYARGSLLITKGDNQGRYEDFDREVIQITNKNKKSIDFLNTGIVLSGSDIGSDYMKYIKAPKVAIIGGDGVSPTAYGEVWYYFEEVIDYPITTLHTSYLNEINLSQYDIVVMPSGNYGKFSKKLLEFAQNGGKIIALDRATSILARHPNTVFNNKKSTNIISKNKKNIKYGERDRASASRLVAGSIYKIHLDNTHPLGFGFGNSVHIIKRSSTVFESLASNGWTVGTFKDDSHISGFVGADLKQDLKNSAALAVENYGNGTIVYFPDSPIFRGFWHSGKLLFGNAVFFVGQ